MARQGRSTAALFLVAVGLLSVAVDVASAAEYVVGSDITGWIIPSDTYYEDWLADKTFTTGDVLVFQYPEGSHTVVQLSKAAYTKCNVTDTIKSYTTGKDKVVLDTAGDYYFACGIILHCSLGQKIQVTVSEGSADPSPKTSPPPAARSPLSSPAPSSASGLHAAGLGALACTSVFMVLVASLVF